MVNTNVFTNTDESIVFYFTGSCMESFPCKFPYVLNQGKGISTSPEDTIKRMTEKYDLKEVTDRDKSSELRKKASSLPKLE